MSVNLFANSDHQASTDPKYQATKTPAIWCKPIEGACKLTMHQHERELSKHIELHGTSLKSVDHRHLASHQHARLSGEQHNKSDTGREGGGRIVKVWLN